ncbi:MAG: hypothetical protein ACLQBX_03345 [Candidatus Limnocylindrales bacterium]
MTRPTAPVPVTRVRGGQSRVRVAVAMAAVAMALAVVKPWAPGGDAAGMAMAVGASPGAVASIALTAASDSPSDMPDTTSVGVLEPLPAGASGIIDLPGGGTLDCADPQGWQVVLDATTGGLATRTWVAVDPGPAMGPLDPAAPLIRIVSGPVARLGFCAPVPADGAASSGWTVGVWRIERDAAGVWRIERDAAGVPRVVHLAQIGPAGGSLGGLTPATGLPGAPDAWAPGQYALGLQAHGSASPGAWLVVELVAAA